MTAPGGTTAPVTQNRPLPCSATPWSEATRVHAGGWLGLASVTGLDSCAPRAPTRGCGGKPGGFGLLSVRRQLSARAGRGASFWVRRTHAAAAGS